MSFEREEKIKELRDTYKDIKRTGVNLLLNLNAYAGQIGSLRSELVALRNAELIQEAKDPFIAKIAEIDGKIQEFKDSVTSTLGL